MQRPFCRPKRALFLLALVTLSGCMTITVPPLRDDAELRSETITWQGRSLHSWRSGRAGATPLLLVHGSPGDGLGWRQYLADAELQKHFEMVAVDRLGFGQTGRPSANLAGNTAAIIALLQRFDQPAVLIGHSYGGPLTLAVAALAPQRVRACVLLAAPGAPQLGKTHALNWVVENSPVKWLLAPLWRSSNTEMLALRRDLGELQLQLSNVRGEVVLIQGKNDRLVNPRNLDFLREHLTAANVRSIEVPEQGHFLPWEQFDLIKQQLLSMHSRAPDAVLPQHD